MNTQEATSVILVDEQDNVIGQAEKLQAHQLNLRHSAFSIFIFRYENSSLQVLMQQRAKQKYHSGGLWTNTCCSHLIKDKSLIECAGSRLQEEVGLTAPLHYLGWFHYTCEVGNGLFENENDHLLIGFITGNEPFQINPLEVENVKWVEWNEVKLLVEKNSSTITAWLKPAVENLQKLISDKQIMHLCNISQGDNNE
jgi:isopentenyl-diphosphate delta-isomerase type 1